MLQAIIKLVKEKVHRLMNTAVYVQRVNDFDDRKRFYSSFLKRNDLCFDVGANYGNRVEVFLDLKCKVIAIEPQSKCVSYLKLKFGNRVYVEKLGLSDAPGELKLHLSESSTVASFSNSWISEVKKQRFKEENWNRHELVKLVTLDHLILIHGRPKFIKIDVEGFELNVLKGLHTPVDFLCIEYTTPEFTDQLLLCVEEMIRLDPNYKCNFSIAEQNHFEELNWVNIEIFHGKIKENDSFLKGFGDVYFSLLK